MPEYLDDPSVLTKDKLKSELLAHNVELPSGNPTKDVYVHLYLKNLTAQNKKHGTATTLDAFSSDEELPPPVVSNRSRSSGRKATRKTDKVRPDELDVTALTDEGLRDELLKHGVNVGPIVATTRKLYEKKLQKLLDDGPAQPPQPQLVLTEIQVNHNGNSESDLYSDKEDEVTPEPEPEPKPEPEPVAETEPVPVVERLVRSRGKTPVTGRTRSSQHQTKDQLVDGEDNDEEPVLNVKRRSRRLSHRTIVTEDLRPILTDHKPDSPAQAEPHSTLSRPAQLYKDELETYIAKPSVDSSRRPVTLLNTALLEEPEPMVKPAVQQNVTPLNPVFRSKNLPEELSSQRAVKPLSTLERPARVDPVTFNPICDISPIKSQEPHWTRSDQSGPKTSGVSTAGEECAPPDVRWHGWRQQKINNFVSTCNPAKTHSYTPTLSKDVLVRQVEKIVAGDQTPKRDEDEVLKELFPNDINSPMGISATCRRPIRGAAGRPVKSSDLWNDENSLFSPKNTTKTSSLSSSYTEKLKRVNNPLSSIPSTSFTSSTSTSTSAFSSSRLLSAAPPGGQTKPVRRSLSLWIKLFLLAVVAAFLFLVYQAMETNTIAPFRGSEVSSDSTV